MAEYEMILTNAGLAAYANAAISQSKVNITHVAFGDGGGTAYTPTQTQTALRRERYRTLVAKVSIPDANPHWVEVLSSIPATVGGWYIREVGLFNDSGVLLAIAKYPEEYKPALSSGVTKDSNFKTIIQHQNAGSTELKADLNVINASQQWTQDQLAETNNAIFAAVGDSANRLRALEFERERFNKQTLRQGRATITNTSHNGYFKTADAFVVVSIGGFAQITTDYDVNISLVSGDSGLVGDLVVYDKTLNGFKVKMTGSAPLASFIWTLINKGVA